MHRPVNTQFPSSNTQSARGHEPGYRCLFAGKDHLRAPCDVHGADAGKLAKDVGRGRKCDAAVAFDSRFGYTSVEHQPRMC